MYTVGTQVRTLCRYVCIHETTRHDYMPIHLRTYVCIQVYTHTYVSVNVRIHVWTYVLTYVHTRTIGVCVCPGKACWVTMKRLRGADFMIPKQFMRHSKYVAVYSVCVRVCVCVLCFSELILELKHSTNSTKWSKAILIHTYMDVCIKLTKHIRMYIRMYVRIKWSLCRGSLYRQV